MDLNIKNWFSDYHNAKFPDIKGISQFGCEDNIFQSLLSCYLFNLTLQAYSSDTEEYKILTSRISIQIKETVDQGLQTFIINQNNIKTKTNTIRDSLSKCFNELTKFYKSKKDQFLRTFSRYYNNASDIDSCFSFMNHFKVAITLINENPNPYIFEPRVSGRYMRLTIIKINNKYHIPCTKLICRSYEHNLLTTIQRTCNSEPYIFTNNISVSLTPSPIKKNQENLQQNIFNNENISMNRQPINSFPNLNSNFIEELSTDYSSFIRISDKNNQIQAFAYQFISYFNRFPNDKYLEVVYDYFIEKKTMYKRLKLKKAIGLKNIKLDELIENCKTLLSLAVKCKESLKKLPELQINNYLKKDFNTLKLLCKIFGISTIITLNDRGKISRSYFYQKRTLCKPIFHFLATSYQENQFKLSVLITRREEYLDNYNPLSGLCNYRKSLISNFQENDLVNKLKQNELKKKSTKIDEFFKKLSDVHNSFVSNSFNSINENKPFYMKEIIEKEEIRLLKIKAEEISKLDENYQYLNNYKILNFDLCQFEVNCHYCNKNFSSERVFYAKDGCCFHFDCMKKYFLKKFQENVFQGRKIHDYELECPKCPNKRILVINFLKDNENSKYFRNFQVKNDKIATCCLCISEFDYQIDIPIDFNQNFHCKLCLIRINTEGRCVRCKASKEVARCNLDNRFTCKNCGIITIFDNFIYNESHKGFCKKCWLICIINHYNPHSIDDYKKISVYALGKDMVIYCFCCNYHRISKFNDKKCKSCSVKICFQCVDNNMNCPSCSSIMTENLLDKWVE